MDRKKYIRELFALVGTHSILIINKDNQSTLGGFMESLLLAACNIFEVWVEPQYFMDLVAFFQFLIKLCH
jgi:hypothetical protein